MTLMVIMPSIMTNSTYIFVLRYPLILGISCSQRGKSSSSWAIITTTLPGSTERTTASTSLIVLPILVITLILTSSSSVSSSPGKLSLLICIKASISLVVPSIIKSSSRLLITSVASVLGIMILLWILLA